jgi:hypothetical protein
MWHTVKDDVELSGGQYVDSVEIMASKMRWIMSLQKPKTTYKNLHKIYLVI